MSRRLGWSTRHWQVLSPPALPESATAFEVRPCGLVFTLRTSPAASENRLGTLNPEEGAA